MPAWPDGPEPLDARNVRCVLGDTLAVDGVSLHVALGRCVALIGESGVGAADVTQQPPAELRRRIGVIGDLRGKAAGHSCTHGHVWARGARWGTSSRDLALIGERRLR